jgi:hypothetical protein
MPAGAHSCRVLVCWSLTLGQIVDYDNVFQQGKGEILLSLCFAPELGRLTIAVIKAKDLPAKDSNGSSGILAVTDSFSFVL